MGKRLSIAVAFLLAILGFAHPKQVSGPTIQIPAGGGPMPNYFSGTNCRASGSAQLGSGVEHAELYLIGNGVATLVASFVSDDEQLPMSISLAAMFDSSHYSPGTTLSVKLSVKCANIAQPYVLTAGSVPVKNRLIVYEYPDPNIAPVGTIIAGHMANKNYTVYGTGNSLFWSAQTYLGDLSGATASVCSTHGNVPFHWSGTNDNIYPTSNPYNYLAYRTSQIGSTSAPNGLPPFNSGQPPLNFLHLLGCLCGQNPIFLLGATYPGDWAYPNSVIQDQCYLGYRPLISTEQADEHAEFIWSRLAAGKNMSQIVVDIDDAIDNYPYLFLCWETYQDYENHNEQYMVADDWKVYGDPCMRMKGVWCPWSPPINDWKRQI
ncbi:MAG: hypothetical protein ABL949_05240 [Fimbriimonadaceae bacterium]